MTIGFINNIDDSIDLDYKILSEVYMNLTISALNSENVATTYTSKGIESFTPLKMIKEIENRTEAGMAYFQEQKIILTNDFSTEYNL